MYVYHNTLLDTHTLLVIRYADYSVTRLGENTNKLIDSDSDSLKKCIGK